MPHQVMIMTVQLFSFDGGGHFFVCVCFALSPEMDSECSQWQTAPHASTARLVGIAFF